ncbi:hypothetical protein HK102_003166, partial [Quaeritorhiza haematococci]
TKESIKQEQAESNAPGEVIDSKAPLDDKKVLSHRWINGRWEYRSNYLYRTLRPEWQFEIMSRGEVEKYWEAPTKGDNPVTAQQAVMTTLRL